MERLTRMARLLETQRNAMRLIRWGEKGFESTVAADVAALTVESALMNGLTVYGPDQYRIHSRVHGGIDIVKAVRNGDLLLVSIQPRYGRTHKRRRAKTNHPEVKESSSVFRNYRFFSRSHEDDFIQFELDVDSKFEPAIMAILGWESLAEEVVGELPLSIAQVRQIERVIQQPLPENLDLFIGVRA
jgi:hypothetical protein